MSPDVGENRIDLEGNRRKSIVYEKDLPLTTKKQKFCLGYLN